MDLINGLFGAKTRPVVAEPPKPTATDAMIKLQREIDALNTEIMTFDRQMKEKHRQAKEYKRCGNLSMATQALTQRKELEEAIKMANVNVSHLIKKQMTLRKVTMIKNTHDGLHTANDVLKSMNDGMDVTKLQDTLIDNQEIEDGVDELAGYLEDNAPYASADLNSELDKLSLTDSETDIDYDYPAVARHPIITSPAKTTGTTNTTSTTTTTTSIPRSNIMETLGLK